MSQCISEHAETHREFMNTLSLNTKPKSVVHMEQGNVAVVKKTDVGTVLYRRLEELKLANMSRVVLIQRILQHICETHESYLQNYLRHQGSYFRCVQLSFT